MYRISKRFEFSAGHMLAGLPEDHQCSRLHGHNYIVEVVLESALLNEVGFVRDYGELTEFKHWLDDNFDHRFLGEGNLSTYPYPVLEGEGPDIKGAFNENPTAENMAKAFYLKAATLYPEVSMVGVSETPKTWAWYAPQNLTLEVLEDAIRALPEPTQAYVRENLLDPR